MVGGWVYGLKVNKDGLSECICGTLLWICNWAYTLKMKILITFLLISSASNIQDTKAVLLLDMHNCLVPIMTP